MYFIPILLSILKCWLFFIKCRQLLIVRKELALISFILFFLQLQQNLIFLSLSLDALNFLSEIQPLLSLVPFLIFLGCILIVGLFTCRELGPGLFYQLHYQGRIRSWSLFPDYLAMHLTEEQVWRQRPPWWFFKSTLKFSLLTFDISFFVLHGFVDLAFVQFHFFQFFMGGSTFLFGLTHLYQYSQCMLVVSPFYLPVMSLKCLSMLESLLPAMALR
ncbi:hypothetical protein FGO68_gene7857 [Halteria grandinella]|uniref:Uncharacterized protein n=1 Tax=Halteria grandinella TaxID=5974 RepID=A0A8J8P3C8_HALGN|nr:hypothetical protein FGO68_gene7857 [Halteria grandinella]